MAEVQVQRTENTLQLSALGHWDVQSIAEANKLLQSLNVERYKNVNLDTQHIKSIDTAGAWIIYRFLRHCQDNGLRVDTPNLHSVLAELFEKFPKDIAKFHVQPKKENFFIQTLTILGCHTYLGLERAIKLLDFLGQSIVRLLQSIAQGNFQLKATLVYIEYTGIQALPIVGTIAFLIGIVLIYQAVFQLRRFGAEIFAVDMLAISMSREIGILLTAIIVAGRSGSAFTAQIGTMKLNQEIDALRVLGMNPLNVLVIPRLIALMISLPLLTFYALVMGLIGGAVMCYFNLNMGLIQYMSQLHQALTLQSFMVGMVKSPFFAFIIALVGCFEGMRVSGGAASVGQHTTRSVVEAIFLVIIFNALFSVVFTYIGV